MKAANFCAYQERSQQEVRDKLYSYGLYKEVVEDIIADLITEDFINEERFAKAYIGGKFRVKKWGRNKILHHLQYHRLSPYCIRKGLSEIDEQDYGATLREVLVKNIKGPISDYKNKARLAKYAIGRGYEAELVWAEINNMAKEG